MATRIKKIGVRNIRQSKYPLIIGYFGCIHVMHERLLSKHHPFNVLTFSEFGAKKSDQIYNLKYRLINLSKTKPSNIFIFDIEKNNFTGEDFIEKVLKKINPSRIVVGGDFKFGYDHQGIDLLKQHFNVDVVSYNNKISTTEIYKLLKDNKIEEANALMMFPYYYESKWIEGKQNGRKIGINTINLAVDHPFVLEEGSYVSRLHLGKWKLQAITFYGKSKTFGITKPTLEVHVISKTIPPRFVIPSFIRNKMKVEILKYLRPNNKFAQKEQLVEAIKKDIDVAKHYFAHNK